MNYYFITGTSRGIGYAITNKLLASVNNIVIGISRTNPFPEHNNYIHFAVDLSDMAQVDEALPDIFTMPRDPKRMILVNNAGTLGQSGYLGEIDNIELENLFNLNVTTPSLLVNTFLKEYTSVNCPKTIVNIGSGAGKRPIDGWAGYCASKAALDMLTRVVEEEQRLRGNDVRIFSMAPGVVDTSMQEQIRNTPKEKFSTVDRFHQLKEEGELFSPEEIADKFLYMIENEQEFKETEVSARDF